MVTSLHIPHAVLVRLHVRKINVVILTLETAFTVGVLAVAYPCRYDFPSRMKPWMLPDPRHRGLTTMRTLFTNSVTGNKEGDKGLMLLYPDGQHTLAFYIKCVPPVGQASVSC